MTVMGGSFSPLFREEQADLSISLSKSRLTAAPSVLALSSDRLRNIDNVEVLAQ